VPNVVRIYTDGACKGNPGPGGWGALLRWGRVEKELFGGEPDTTNNRMELTAAIEALRHIGAASAPVAIHTDSTYVIRGIREWIRGWRRRGWRTAGGGDVLVWAASTLVRTLPSPIVTARTTTAVAPLVAGTRGLGIMTIAPQPIQFQPSGYAHFARFTRCTVNSL